MLGMDTSLHTPDVVPDGKGAHQTRKGWELVCIWETQSSTAWWDWRPAGLGASGEAFLWTGRARPPAVLEDTGRRPLWLVTLCQILTPRPRSAGWLWRQTEKSARVRGATSLSHRPVCPGTGEPGARRVGVQESCQTRRPGTTWRACGTRAGSSLGASRTTAQKARWRGHPRGAEISSLGLQQRCWRVVWATEPFSVCFCLGICHITLLNGICAQERVNYTFNNSSMAGNELNRSQSPQAPQDLLGCKVQPAHGHLGSEVSFPTPLGRAFRLSFPSPLRPFPFLNRHYERAQGVTLKCVVVFSSTVFPPFHLLESWRCHRRKANSFLFYKMGMQNTYLQATVRLLITCVWCLMQLSTQ